MTEPGRARELELLRRAERVTEATGEACAICSAAAHQVVEVRDEAGLAVRLGVCRTCRASFVAAGATMRE